MENTFNYTYNVQTLNHTQQEQDIQEDQIVQGTYEEYSEITINLAARINEISAFG